LAGTSLVGPQAAVYPCGRRPAAALRGGASRGRKCVKRRNTDMLDGIDTAVIEQVKRDNAEFRSLLEAHQQYEAQLEAYNDLRFMTSEQELERKRLQKLKLQGKDRMLAILRQSKLVPGLDSSTLSAASPVETQ